MPLLMIDPSHVQVIASSACAKGVIFQHPARKPGRSEGHGQVCGVLSGDSKLRCPTAIRKARGDTRGITGKSLENFIRDSVVTFWHQTCTAKMGRDSMSVVDGKLKVYGIDNLRIADGSIMPRITTGNTMAPCVVIGERAGEMLKAAHGI
jgi:choline dehydrogenase-like flavoprotein